MGCVVMVNIFVQRCLLVWTLPLILLLGVCHSEAKSKSWNLLHTQNLFMSTVFIAQPSLSPASTHCDLNRPLTFVICAWNGSESKLNHRHSNLGRRSQRVAGLASRDSWMHDVVTFYYCTDAAAIPEKWNWVQLYYFAHGRGGVIEREDCGGETQNEQLCIHDVIRRKTKRRNISQYILRNN